MGLEGFHLGQPTNLDFKVTSSTGSTVLVDPGGLTFYLTEPDGTTYSYVWGTNAQLTTVAAGHFRVSWTVAKRGRHSGGWVATSSHACADEFQFDGLERLY